MAGHTRSGETAALSMRDVPPTMRCSESANWRTSAPVFGRVFRPDIGYGRWQTRSAAVAAAVVPLKRQAALWRARELGSSGLACVSAI